MRYKLKQLTPIPAFLLLATLASAQEKSTHSGSPAVRYQIVKKASYYIEITTYQGAKAIAFPAAFEAHESSARAWGLAIATLGHSEIVDKPKGSFGTLYITADKVIFEPGEEKYKKYTWSIPRSSFLPKHEKFGQRVELTGDTPVNGTLHFTPFADKDDKPWITKTDSEMIVFMEKKPPAPAAAVLSDYHSAFTDFDAAYTRLAAIADVHD